MNRVRLIGTAAVLIGIVGLAGCGDKGEVTRGGRPVKRAVPEEGTVTAAGVVLPGDLKLKTLWDLKIRKGSVVKTWVVGDYVMVATEGPNLLYLLRKKDGYTHWVCEFAKPVEIKYPPSVSADAVMIMSDERIVRVHRSFGQIICKLKPGIPVSSRPVLETWVESGDMAPVIYAPSYGDGRLWSLRVRKLDREVPNPVPGEAPIKFPVYATTRGWSRGAPRGGGHILAPLVKVGGFIYACTTNGYVMAIKSHDGSHVWPPIQTQGTVQGGVSIAKDRLLFGSSDFKLYCLDLLSGEKKWELPTGSVVSARPLGDMAAGVVVCVGEGQGLIGVESKKGERIWTNAEAVRILGMGEEAVYAEAKSGDLLALDKKTGKPVWRSSMAGFANMFVNEEQFEVPGKPFYLIGLARGNSVVCMVEKDYEPGMILADEKKPAKRKPIPVVGAKK